MAHVTRVASLIFCLAFVSAAEGAPHTAEVGQFFAGECPTLEGPPGPLHGAPNFHFPQDTGFSLASECGAVFDIAEDGATSNIRTLCTGSKFDETMTARWSDAMRDYVAAINYGTMSSSFDHRAHSCVSTIMHFMITSAPKPAPLKTN
jgi:hypothetical protein